MKFILTIIFGLSFHLCFSQTIKPEQIDSLINGIKKTVLENYVLTDKANLISYSLTARHYTGIQSIDSLTKKLNEDLFNLSDDKHLFLQYRPEVADNLINHKDIHKEQDKKEKREHYGFEQADVIGNNIGYIKLNYFADATHAQKTILKYTSRLKNTSAIIIDLRNNFGGSGTMIQLLSGIFLPADQEEILKINYKTQGDVTLKSTHIDPSQKIIHQPIYILISSQNFSAGEAFTLIMKNRGRATIIGETTAGAGNVAGPYPVSSQFVLSVPVAIIVDPKTNVGWEHTGVTPDINVNPDLAMEKAIEFITSGFDHSSNMGTLRQKLEDMIRPYNATIGISLLNIETGDSLTIHNQIQYPMQSVYKFPLAIAVLKEVDKHKFTLDQSFHLTKEDLRPQTWSPLRDKYPDGNIDMTLFELLRYMISLSDNNVCDFMFRIMGGPKHIDDYMDEIGFHDINIAATEDEMHKSFDAQYSNWTSAYAMTRLLNDFYQYKYLSQISRDALMSLLIESSNSANRIMALLPKGTEVAHKTGTSGTNDEGMTTAVNDVGIVSLPNGRHMAISVFVSRSMESFETNEKIIADIALAAFEYFSK